MTIERAHVLAKPKPWGVADLRPWSDFDHQTDLIGELSFEREVGRDPDTSLLLKLLFTSAPLSIQVHPNDAYARSIGLPNGKTEAWYILSAAPDAQIALGLKQSITPQHLRWAIDDGSISELVAWQSVKAHDIVTVPAGTIHAIGAGIVIAEIQQRSDVTFRLFDHGRGRPLDVDRGMAAARLGPVGESARPKQLTDERKLLVATSDFVFEHVRLAPGSAWRLDAERETWLFALGGNITAGSINLVQGEAILGQSECFEIRAGRLGVECLLAYTGHGGPITQLLTPVAAPNSKWQRQPGVTKASVASIRPGP